LKRCGGFSSRDLSANVLFTYGSLAVFPLKKIKRTVHLRSFWAESLRRWLGCTTTVPLGPAHQRPPYLKRQAGPQAHRAAGRSCPRPETEEAGEGHGAADDPAGSGHLRPWRDHRQDQGGAPHAPRGRTRAGEGRAEQGSGRGRRRPRASPGRAATATPARGEAVGRVTGPRWSS
jgi:hypothetical protein